MTVKVTGCTFANLVCARLWLRAAQLWENKIEFNSTFHIRSIKKKICVKFPRWGESAVVKSTKATLGWWSHRQEGGPLGSAHREVQRNLSFLSPALWVLGQGGRGMEQAQSSVLESRLMGGPVRVPRLLASHVQKLPLADDPASTCSKETREVYWPSSGYCWWHYWQTMKSRTPRIRRVTFCLMAPSEPFSCCLCEAVCSANLENKSGVPFITGTPSVAVSSGHLGEHDGDSTWCCHSETFVTDAVALCTCEFIGTHLCVWVCLKASVYVLVCSILKNKIEFTPLCNYLFLSTYHQYIFSVTSLCYFEVFKKCTTEPCFAYEPSEDPLSPNA